MTRTRPLKLELTLKKSSKKGNHRDNVLLKPNDLISFPKEDSTISVLEVQRETATPYDKRISLRDTVTERGSKTILGLQKRLCGLPEWRCKRNQELFIFPHQT